MFKCELEKKTQFGKYAHKHKDEIQINFYKNSFANILKYFLLKFLFFIINVEFLINNFCLIFFVLIVFL